MQENILFSVGMRAPGVTPTTTNKELMQDNRVEMINGSELWYSKHNFSKSTAGDNTFCKSSFGDALVFADKQASRTCGIAESSK